MIGIILAVLLVAYLVFLSRRPLPSASEPVEYELSLAPWAQHLFRFGGLSMLGIGLILAFVAAWGGMGMPVIEGIGSSLAAGMIGMSVLQLEHRSKALFTRKGIYFAGRYLPWPRDGNLRLNSGTIEVTAGEKQGIAMRIGGPAYDISRDDIEAIRGIFGTETHDE